MHTPGDTAIEWRGSVSFSHSTRVSFIDVHEGENDEKWYSESDYTSFKRSISSTVHAMHKAITTGGNISSVKRCTRGIEFACSNESMKKQEEGMRAVIAAVLAEQKRQRTERANDAFLVAAASCAASEEARENACLAGMADANSARKIYFGKKQGFGASVDNFVPTTRHIPDVRKRLDVLQEAISVASCPRAKIAHPQPINDRLGLHVNSSPRRPSSICDTDTSRIEVPLGRANQASLFPKAQKPADIKIKGALVEFFERNSLKNKSEMPFSRISVSKNTDLVDEERIVPPRAM